ncbi:hypothetical protein FOA52_015050 [Chlamydomonas sp. UWO 241]|nr:hypothetical protein FOA52_015050 [Chlamydomonas sp. UWO 241]
MRSLLVETTHPQPPDGLLAGIEEQDQLSSSSVAAAAAAAWSQGMSQQGGAGPSQASGSQSAMSQMGGVVSGGKGVSLLSELVGFLNKALQQQAPVRRALYAGLTRIVATDPGSLPVVAELLLPHLRKCVAAGAGGVFRSGTQQTERDALELAHAYASTREALLSCSAAQLGFESGSNWSPQTPAGQERQLQAALALGSLEVIVEEAVEGVELDGGGGWSAGARDTLARAMHLHQQVYALSAGGLAAKRPKAPGKENKNSSAAGGSAASGSAAPSQAVGGDAGAGGPGATRGAGAGEKAAAVKAAACPDYVKPSERRPHLTARCLARLCTEVAAAAAPAATGAARGSQLQGGGGGTKPAFVCFVLRSCLSALRCQMGGRGGGGADAGTGDDALADALSLALGGCGASAPAAAGSGSEGDGGGVQLSSGGGGGGSELPTLAGPLFAACCAAVRAAGRGGGGAAAAAAAAAATQATQTQQGTAGAAAAKAALAAAAAADAVSADLAPLAARCAKELLSTARSLPQLACVLRCMPPVVTTGPLAMPGGGNPATAAGCGVLGSEGSDGGLGSEGASALLLPSMLPCLPHLRSMLAALMGGGQWEAAGGLVESLQAIGRHLPSRMRKELAVWVQELVMDAPAAASEADKAKHFEGLAKAAVCAGAALRDAPGDLELLTAVAKDLQSVIGRAGEDTQTQPSAMPILREDVAQQVAGTVLGLLDRAMAQVERALAGAKGGEVGKGGALSKQQLRVQAEAAARVQAVVGVLSCITDTRLGLPAVLEAQTHSLTTCYKLLASVAKTATSAASGVKPPPPLPSPLASLIGAVNRELSPGVYSLIEDLEEVDGGKGGGADGEGEGNGAKGKGARLKRARAIRKQVKSIPALVFQIESWEKQLGALGKATGSDLFAGTKRTVNRDFRLEYDEGQGDDAPEPAAVPVTAGPKPRKKRAAAGAGDGSQQQGGGAGASGSGGSGGAGGGLLAPKKAAQKKRARSEQAAAAAGTSGGGAGGSGGVLVKAEVQSQGASQGGRVPVIAQRRKQPKVVKVSEEEAD